MDHFSLNPFWIFLQTTDWITVGCFYLAGIWFGFRIKTWTVAGKSTEIDSVNRILKKLKIRARKHHKRRRVNLDDIESLIDQWVP